jgi:hypothetical protein
MLVAVCVVFPRDFYVKSLLGIARKKILKVGGKNSCSRIICVVVFHVHSPLHDNEVNCVFQILRFLVNCPIDCSELFAMPLCEHGFSY